MGDPIYRAPAPTIDEQYAELAWAMGLDPEPTPPTATEASTSGEGDGEVSDG